jgi:hypothetical protein
MNVIRWVGFGTVILAGTLHVAAEQAPLASATNRVVARVGGNSSFATVSPNAFGTIQGNALNSTNGQLPNVTVRLRDARFGRVMGSQLTDQTGLFTFRNLDPGSYIVEITAEDHTVLAASQVLNINGGEAISAIVKLPFRITPFANILASTVPNTASAIVTQVAATTLLAVSPIGEPTCSQ